MSDFLRWIMTHPFWDVVGVLAAVVTVGKILHPGIKFPNWGRM